MQEKASSDRQAHLSPGRQRELANLAGRLGHRFKDLARLDQALRHSSFAHENPEAGPSNEQWSSWGTWSWP